MLPALHDIRSTGIRGAALRIASVQLPALLLTEFAEQRLSGFAHPSLAAVFGQGHITAPLVQLAMVALAAWAVVRFSRSACDHVHQLTRAARSVATVFIRAPRRPGVRIALRTLAAPDASRPKRRALLALRIANRPPPAIAAARA
jgi:hypothetical protein